MFFRDRGPERKPGATNVMEGNCGRGRWGSFDLRSSIMIPTHFELGVIIGKLIASEHGQERRRFVIREWALTENTRLTSRRPTSDRGRA